MKVTHHPEVVPDWETPWEPSFLGRIRNSLEEIILHISRVTQTRKNLKLIIFPCGTKESNPASLLRAYTVGATLREHFGWRVTIVPPRFSLKQRLRILKLEQPDIILMQMERHPLNRPKLYAPFPVIFDIDDADFLWDYARELVQECCRDSVGVIAGSQFVADWARGINKNVNVVWTGSPAIIKEKTPSQLIRKPIVAWGHSRPHDYPKESKFIEEILIRVSQKTAVEYWIFGVNDNNIVSDLTKRLSQFDVNIRVLPPMSFNLFSKQLESAAIGLQVLSPENLYSQGKSFGKILNYISAGACVVASRGADHSEFFESGRNGMLADTIDEWVDTIVWLLKNPDERERMSKEANKDFQEQLSIKVVSSQYDRILRDSVVQ